MVYNVILGALLALIWFPVRQACVIHPLKISLVRSFRYLNNGHTRIVSLHSLPSVPVCSFLSFNISSLTFLLATPLTSPLSSWRQWSIQTPLQREYKQPSPSSVSQTGSGSLLDIIKHTGKDQGLPCFSFQHSELDFCGSSSLICWCWSFVWCFQCLLPDG